MRIVSFDLLLRMRCWNKNAAIKFMQYRYFNDCPSKATTAGRI